MAFSKRIVRMKKDQAGLSKIEKSRDASAIASEYIELLAESEVQEIGAPRASSLYAACIRKHVLGTMLNRSEKRWLSLRDKLLFGIGVAVHKWIQNEPDVFGDRRRGWWRCISCNTVRYFGAPPKTKCEHCGARKEATVYHEHYMQLSDPLRVTGHTDMFFEVAQGLFRIVDMKTIEGEEFKKLKHPLVQNEWQVATYIWGCSQDKRLPVKLDGRYGYVAYIGKKQYQDILPVKMFVVEATPFMVGQIKDKLQQYADGVRSFPDKLPPPASACTRNWDCWQAKTCAVRQECMEYLND